MARPFLNLVPLFCIIASFAGTPTPTARLLFPASATSETDRPTIRLQGVADGGTEAVNVLWSNQYGKRGVGKLENSGTGGAHAARWKVDAVPLRVGANLITVSIVDAENRSVPVQLAVFRKIAGGARGESQGVHSGLWRGRPVFYEIRNGMAVVEGDIVLGSAASMVPNATASASPNLSEADRRLGPHAAGNAIDYLSQLWPNVGGVYEVPYVLQNGASDLVTAAVDAFNLSFAGLIQFVARTSQANYVNIDIDPNYFPGQGYSSIGMAGGEQTLTCSSECTVATMLHEMGHTVGLLHEHQRPDRSNFVTFAQANADLPNVAGNFALYRFDEQTLGLYDYASVMHYGAFEFTSAGRPVLESIPPGIPLSNSSGYSMGDLDQVQRLYGAAASAVNVTTNPAGLQFIADGVTYAAPQSFAWTIGSTHTLDLPPDPQQANPADGSVYAYGRWNDTNSRSHRIIVFGGVGTLTSPANRPAVTVYEANFVRLQPFATSVYPAGAGTLTPNPEPVSEFGGAFYTDRQLVSLTATANAGQNFYGLFNLPYPTADNPKQFYVQAPYTPAQAVFTSIPVTIVGESITGPNTWNPLLEASVDGSATPLPAGFTQIYQPSWTPGSTHTLDVASTQSPVTTNVFYTWDAWSDGGSQSHTIQQVSSGTQTISASFTPSYSAYSLVNPYCGGTVIFTPVGNPLGSFVSFPDGTLVSSAAAANATYPGMVFAGWSGSLTGGVNPDSTTIHNQFVPTANFNATSTPISISSFYPANAVANGIAMDLTVNGAGFTANTYTYWNGNYRPNIFVNSTQLTMHLDAGDVATAGGQDVFVGNLVSNPQNPNDLCVPSYDATFDVKASAGSSGGVFGDGDADLIWQNDDTGQVTVHYYGGAQGSEYMGWNWLNSSGEPSGWVLVGAADFDGNGVPDLVWEYAPTRQVTVNYYGGSDGSTFLGWSWMNYSGVPGWTLVAVADMDGNGVPDLIWQDISTRQVTVNYYGGAGGASFIGWNWLNAPGVPGWTVVGAKDYDGNGVPDLVWQNDATAQATVNYYGGTGGATYIGWNWLAEAGYPGWRSVVPR